MIFQGQEDETNNRPAEKESQVGRPLLLELFGREVVFANGWPPEIVYSSWTASPRTPSYVTTSLVLVIQVETDHTRAWLDHFSGPECRSM